VTNEIPSTDLLDGTEHGLDPRIGGVWAALSAAVPLVVAAGGAIAIVVAGAGLGPALVVFVVGILLAVLAAWWARLAWARWRWRALSDALDLRHGVLISVESLVPYHRIQPIDVVRDPLERLLGLSSLILRTASASSDGKIPGLPASTADALRARLLALAGVDDAV
jgi:membrane protein YdbS with pleckstrin-like domain